MSAGMGDWLSGGGKKHHKKRHAPAPAPAMPRFAQAQASAAAPGDELLPLTRSSVSGSGYSMPQAHDSEKALSAENTPIARDLPKEPTPLLGEPKAPAPPVRHRHARNGAAAAHPPPAPAPAPASGSVVRRAAAHAAASRAESYELPTQFAGTVMAKGKSNDEALDPDSFFGLKKVDAKADKLSKLGTTARCTAAVCFFSLSLSLWVGCVSRQTAV